MGGAGRFFQNRQKKTEIHLTCHLRVYLRKLMGSMPSRESIIVYKNVLSVLTQEFSLVVWLHVRPENEPPKNEQCRYFWVFSDRPKEKTTL